MTISEQVVPAEPDVDPGAAKGTEPDAPPAWERAHQHGAACYWDLRECRWVCAPVTQG